MNILLWVLQVMLGLYNVIGGIYMVSNYEKLTGEWTASLPGPAWMGFGVLQVLFALILILPGVIKSLRKLVPIAAVWLAVQMVAVALLDVKQHGAAGMVWAIVPALLSVFVAYGRKVIRPL